VLVDGVIARLATLKGLSNAYRVVATVPMSGSASDG